MRIIPISVNVKTKKGLRRVKVFAFIEMMITIMFASGMLYVFLKGASGIGIQFTQIGNWIYLISAILLSLFISYWFVYLKKLYPINIEETETRINES